MISSAASLMILLFSRALALSTLTISRAVSPISDEFQRGSISDESNDFQSWTFIRLILSRARSQNGLGFKCVVQIAVLLLNFCCYFISDEF